MSTNSVIGTRISRLLIVVLAGAVVLGGVPAGASVIDAGPVQVGTSPNTHKLISGPGGVTG
jgi:hypothetical protein